MRTMEKMTSSQPPRLHGLDHLRALAITLVLFFHYDKNFGHPHWFPELINFGWTGVDLFFVLSGFLISSHLFAEAQESGRISLKQFYLKRSFRILPLYLVVVGIYFCFPLLREWEALPPLWKFLTFTQNLGINPRQFGTFSHAWSLCVEEHFYLILPLILIGILGRHLFKKLSFCLLTLFLSGFLIRYYIWSSLYLPKQTEGVSWHHLLYYPSYTRLDPLIVGISIAALCHFQPKVFERISRHGNALILAGILVLAVAYFSCAQFGTFSTTMYGFPTIALGYGFLVFGAVSPSCILYRWNSKITNFISTLSYALYLSHKILIHALQKMALASGVEKNSTTMFLMCLAFCVAGALVLNLTIEKPFLKWRGKFIRKT